MFCSWLSKISPERDVIGFLMISFEAFQQQRDLCTYQLASKMARMLGLEKMYFHGRTTKCAESFDHALFSNIHPKSVIGKSLIPSPIRIHHDRANMTDRRRTNPPNGGTAPPIFLSAFTPTEALQSYRPKRTRQPNELRKICIALLLPSSSKRL